MILKKQQIRIVYHAYTELLLDFALLFLGQEKNYVDQSLSVKQFKGVHHVTARYKETSLHYTKFH